MIAFTRDTPLLTIEHVSLTLGGRIILRDVDEQIRHICREDGQCVGQVVCLLGPSGVGKTQLARIVCGLAPPTSGRVLVADRPVHKGLVGLVPQAYPLFRFLTVREQCLLAAKQGGLSAAAGRDRLAEMATAFGLTPYLEFYPRALSGGTRQRVAIVRQLLCSDHYTVMDEPFSGLDPLKKARVAETITRVASGAQTNTVIVSSQEVTEGMAVADMVWLMGLEPDPALPGAYLPGARVVERYDLAAMGLCWRPDLTSDPVFLHLVADVKTRFKTLGF